MQSLLCAVCTLFPVYLSVLNYSKKVHFWPFDLTKLTAEYGLRYFH